MLLLVVLSIVFILSFSLLFIWIRQANQKDPEEEKMSILMTALVGSVLALLLTGVAAFFLFLVLGSTNVVSELFKLEIGKKDLIIMSVVYLLYLLTIDNLCQVFVKLVSSNIYLFYFVMLWLRMVAFYLIGDYFHMSPYANLVIAGGVALLLSLIEFLFDWRQEQK